MLAIVKPDHLGDLILSSPAIRALAREDKQAVLFVASNLIGAARWLFPELEVRGVDFPHLSKTGEGAARLPNFLSFDAVAVFRRDHVVTPEWAATSTRDFVMPADRNDVHQSVLDYGVARAFIPSYVIDDHFHAPGHSPRRPAENSPIKKVGLSIGSGFHTNSWPVVYWAELARTLMERGVEVWLLGGQAEAGVLQVISRQSGLPEDRIRAGGADFGSFIKLVRTLDLVIASDGGTGHLCSLVAPMLSIFGSSPMFRYAPFGSDNKVITQQLACSPCIQYASNLINGCLSIHCMAGITPEDVLTALSRTPEQMQEERPNLHIYRGVSHVGREALLLQQEYEQQRWE